MKVCIVIHKLLGQSNFPRFVSFALIMLIWMANCTANAIADDTSGSIPDGDTNTEKKTIAGKGASRPLFRDRRQRLLPRLRARLNAPAKPDSGKNTPGQNWKPLKDKWVVSQFGGDGEVVIKDNLITMDFGDPLTGIRWENELPKENYEVELEARRREGFDFFCALTFPVGEKHVSFILGGWGGGVVGISSVDGFDASENETTSFRNFDMDRWYKVRARVDANQIQCWIDDKPAAEQIRKGHEFDIRYEMDQCVPFGVAAFQCKSELRNIRIRKLTGEEIKAAEKEAAKPEE